MGMAQKLLLFWRKPARRCWWEGVELENVDGIDGKLKVWIRRVWTLEMVSYYFNLIRTLMSFACLLTRIWCLERDWPAIRLCIYLVGINFSAYSSVVSSIPFKRMGISEICTIPSILDDKSLQISFQCATDHVEKGKDCFFGRAETIFLS